MAQEVERLLLAKILSSNPSTAKKKKKKEKCKNQTLSYVAWNIKWMIF
jgi:hypothetical protein